MEKRANSRQENGMSKGAVSKIIFIGCETTWVVVYFCDVAFKRTGFQIVHS